MRLVLSSAIVLALAACGQPGQDAASPPSAADPGAPAAAPTEPAAPTPPAPTPGEQGGSADWRAVVSTEDAGRLGRLDQAWRLGRAEAEDKGFAAEVEALGALVDPNAGLAGRLQPAPGAYRCRTIMLGSHDNRGLGFIAYPFFQCVVELTAGGDLILMKTTGSQRTRGLLYPDIETRLIFVGAQAWGMDEQHYPNYGQMPERDQVGVFERIGDNRWRIVMPWPRTSSKLEILELTR